MDQTTVLIPIFGMFFIFGAPIAAWIIFRVLAHRERIEMIRMGLTPPLDPLDARRYARAGYPPQPSGIPPTLTYDVDYPQRSLRKGISLTFIGLALTIGLSFIGYHSSGGPLNGPSMEPGPWLLGGLIPLFVGIAQIIIAILSGARLAAPTQFEGSQARSRSTAPSSGIPSGPFTYRPDNTTELTPPVPPPDLKN